MTVPREFLLPDLGEGLTEAEIVSWLVRPGELVEIDQPLVEVESAKSTVELPSPFAGRVEKLHAAEGDTVVKGGVLITVAEEAVDLVPGTALRAESTDAASGAVLIGYGTTEAAVRTTRAPGTRFGGRGAAPA
ncbi:MAG: biotin/lipoyl-containing protein, partial [Leifsonia sp.]